MLTREEWERVELEMNIALFKRAGEIINALLNNYQH